MMRDQIRSILVWPLYSPRRALAVLVALVALVVAVAMAGGGGTERTDAQPAPTRSPSSSSPAASSPSPSPSASTPPDLNAALDIARGFVAAWADPDHKDDPDAWQKELAPYVTEQFGRKLASTDPRTIRPTEAIKARNTDTGGDTLTQVAVETDDEPVSVLLIWSGGRWWVYDIQPGAQAVE